MINNWVQCILGGNLLLVITELLFTIYSIMAFKMPCKNVTAYRPLCCTDISWQRSPELHILPLIDSDPLKCQEKNKSLGQSRLLTPPPLPDMVPLGVLIHHLRNPALERDARDGVLTLSHAKYLSYDPSFILLPVISESHKT